MQEDLLFFIISSTGILVGVIVFFLFLVYRFRGEAQLRLKTEGAGFDYTKRGVWYAKHVTRPRNLFVYSLTQIASTVVSPFLFVWLLSPSIYYSFLEIEVELLSTFFLYIPMCLCTLTRNDCYKYWGAGKPCPKEEEMGDDLEPDEVDTREDGA